MSTDFKGILFPNTKTIHLPPCDFSFSYPLSYPPYPPPLLLEQTVIHVLGEERVGLYDAGPDTGEEKLPGLWHLLVLEGRQARAREAVVGELLGGGGDGLHDIIDGRERGAVWVRVKLAFDECDECADGGDERGIDGEVLGEGEEGLAVHQHTVDQRGVGPQVASENGRDDSQQIEHNFPHPMGYKFLGSSWACSSVRV